MHQEVSKENKYWQEHIKVFLYQDNDKNSIIIETLLCFWMYNCKSCYVYAIYKCRLRLDYSKKKRKEEKRKEKKKTQLQVWVIPIPISTTKDVICCSNKGYIYH